MRFGRYVYTDTDYVVNSLSKSDESVPYCVALDHSFAVMYISDLNQELYQKCKNYTFQNTCK